MVERRPERLAAAVAGLVLTAAPTRRSHTPQLEVACFRAINDLPNGLYAPLWVVMQFGALAAVPTTAAAVGLRGHRATAGRLLATGTLTWVLAKVVKRLVGRGRPASLLPSVRIRGREASGEGFLSGHAGISSALAATLASASPGLGHWVTGVAVTVSVARVYVGAHLPLDVLGGAALGLVVSEGLSACVPTPGRPPG
jgi:membrane-associated phospholipid phosphatase